MVYDEDEYHHLLRCHEIIDYFSKLILHNSEIKCRMNVLLLKDFKNKSFWGYYNIGCFERTENNLKIHLLKSWRLWFLPKFNTLFYKESVSMHCTIQSCINLNPT